MIVVFDAIGVGLLLVVWTVALVLVGATRRSMRGHIGRTWSLLPGVRRLSVSNRWFSWWFALNAFAWVAAPPHYIVYVTFGIDTLRALDDLFNHDDDSFRRFFEGLRNKVKWKMALPRPQPGPRAAS